MFYWQEDKSQIRSEGSKGIGLLLADDKEALQEGQGGSSADSKKKARCVTKGKTHAPDVCAGRAKSANAPRS